MALDLLPDSSILVSLKRSSKTNVQNQELHFQGTGLKNAALWSQTITFVGYEKATNVII